MKRIPQDAAIQTLLYVIRPDTHIKVIDRLNMYDQGNVVYDGLKSKFDGVEYAKYHRSKVHSIELKDDVLILTIETAYEQY